MGQDEGRGDVGGNRWEIFRRQDNMVGVKTLEKEFIY